MDTAASISSRRETTRVRANLTRPVGKTAILGLFHEWETVNAAARAYVVDESLDADEADELMDRLFFDRADAIEKELMALPTTCAADAFAKVIINTCYGTRIFDWETGALWTEARALTGSSQ